MLEKTIVFGGTRLLGHALKPFLENGLFLGSDSIDLTRDDSNEHLRCLFDNYQPSNIINLAGWNGNIDFNKKYPADIFYKNVLINLNLLTTCCDYRLKTISVLPSCSYPDAPDGILREANYWNGLPNSSVACHGLARRNTLAYAIQLNKQYGFNHRAVVLNNLTGPHDNFDESKTKVAGSFINRFYQAKKNNTKEVICWGTGISRREIMCSEDAARGILEALIHYDDANEPLNITSGEDISIKELAELVAEVVGYEGNIIWDKDRGDGQLKKALSSDKMVSVLPHFKPFYNIRETIKLTVNWYKENHG